MCEEDARARLQRGKRTFLDHGPRSAAPIPRSRDTYDKPWPELWPQTETLLTSGRIAKPITHESTHDKP